MRIAHVLFPAVAYLVNSDSYADDTRFASTAKEAYSVIEGETWTNKDDEHGSVLTFSFEKAQGSGGRRVEISDEYTKHTGEVKRTEVTGKYMLAVIRGGRLMLRIVTDRGDICLLEMFPPMYSESDHLDKNLFSLSKLNEEDLRQAPNVNNGACLFGMGQKDRLVFYLAN
jgi:hypothetical protein